MEDVSDSETDDEIVKIKRKPRNKNSNSNPEPEPTNNKITPVKKKRAKAIIDSSDDDEDGENAEIKSSEDNHKNTDSGNVDGAITDTHNKIFNKSNAIFSSSEDEEDDDLGTKTPIGSDQSLDLQLSPAINLNTPKLNLPRSKLANSPTLASSTDSSPKQVENKNSSNASTSKNNSKNNNTSKNNSDSSASESNKDSDSGSDSNSGSDDDELDGLRLFRNKNAEISTAAPRIPEKKDKKVTGGNKKQKINAQGLADSSDDEGAPYFGDVSKKLGFQN